MNGGYEKFNPHPLFVPFNFSDWLLLIDSYFKYPQILAEGGESPFHLRRILAQCHESYKLRYPKMRSFFYIFYQNKIPLT